MADAAPAQLVCGHFEYRGDIEHPLIAHLPKLTLVQAFDSLAPGTVDSVLPLLVREMRQGGPGSATAMERLAEVLLIQVLRAHLARQSSPRISKAGSVYRPSST